MISLAKGVSADIPSIREMAKTAELRLLESMSVHYHESVKYPVLNETEMTAVISQLKNLGAIVCRFALCITIACPSRQWPHL